jgi:hypothetical protein
MAGTVPLLRHPAHPCNTLAAELATYIVEKGKPLVTLVK